MTLSPLSSSPRAPHVVATGFTTALLGDERTLREFVVGDHVVQSMRSQGSPAVLYLINDSYDPLNERQLRIGVCKDEGRIEQFRPYCGRPIAEIPDPYGCHASYSAHFASRLMVRLSALDVHPIILDTYAAYESGAYAPFIAWTFEHYDEIQQELERQSGYQTRSLFRAQCLRCRSIDATKITRIDAAVSYHCERCEIEHSAEVGALRGKLTWKLDCAARWNLYGIGTEVFSKAHMQQHGTFNVSCHVSRRWFGGQVPAAVEYGNLQVERELSGKLLEVLPPAGFKQMLLGSLARDLVITRSTLEHFAHSYEVRPGTSYSHFVCEELPRRALELDCADWRAIGALPISEELTNEQALIAHANAYSQLVHGRRHGLRQPEAAVIADADPMLVEHARNAVAIAIAVRGKEHDNEKELKARLKIELNVRPMPGVYTFLRRVLGQEHGPSITTLLAILPVDYLAMIQLLLQVFAVGGRSKTPDLAAQKAA